jgi:carbamoyl-phosphate synthase large subunit
VSKATGVALAKLATRVMMGEKLRDLDPWSMRKGGYYSVKESVFPFNRFPGVDVLLGPEMRSTGEVMGMDDAPGMAFMKAQLAAGLRLPTSGTVFLSVNDRDKPSMLPVAKAFEAMGFRILATSGTLHYLEENGVQAERALKVKEGRPNVVDEIKNNRIDLVINTVAGKKTVRDSKAIRQTTLLYNVPYTTTVAGARATAQAIREMQSAGVGVCCLQDYYSNDSQGSRES